MNSNLNNRFLIHVRFTVLSEFRFNVQIVAGYDTAIVGTFRVRVLIYNVSSFNSQCVSLDTKVLQYTGLPAGDSGSTPIISNVYDAPYLPMSLDSVFLGFNTFEFFGEQVLGYDFTFDSTSSASTNTNTN